MYTLQPDKPKKSSRTNLFEYVITMMIAIVALSLLPYVGPPFGPDWLHIAERWYAMLLEWGSALFGF